MKSLEIHENYITLFCLEKKIYDNIILTQNHAWHITKVVYITIYYKQQLRNNTILSHDLFRNAHSNVMLCFMMQAFQDPPLCSSNMRTSSSLLLLHLPQKPRIDDCILISRRRGAESHDLFAWWWKLARTGCTRPLEQGLLNCKPVSISAALI
jgi:hypothetical protein